MEQIRKIGQNFNQKKTSANTNLSRPIALAKVAVSNAYINSEGQEHVVGATIPGDVAFRFSKLDRDHLDATKDSRTKTVDVPSGFLVKEKVFLNLEDVDIPADEAYTTITDWMMANPAHTINIQPTPFALRAKICQLIDASPINGGDMNAFYGSISFDNSIVNHLVHAYFTHRAAGRIEPDMDKSSISFVKSRAELNGLFGKEFNTIFLFSILMVASKHYESDYTGTYGIKAADDSLTLTLVTRGAYSTNAGSRVYSMGSADSEYQLFKLTNQQFSFDVDVSNLPCGLNGASYFVEMDADGGMSEYPSNKAGAKYGTGYCDA
ncbi:hypothetical protein H2203_006383 [Taxawa tesnikishii (nom. ined.)]|nr:hypothetical protein H2203_006383 [Dothideales sp. JES 119]